MRERGQERWAEGLGTGTWDAKGVGVGCGLPLGPWSILHWGGQ